MTDDLEPRLRRDLPAARLPSAPDALHVRLRAVAASEPRPVERGSGWFASRGLVLGIGAIAIVTGLIAVAVGSTHPDRTTLPFASAPVSGAIESPTPVPEPTIVDGLPVMTVSEALEAHAADRLPDGRAAIRGWWSNGGIAHSCAPPPEQTGELELWCSDGEYGITERNEPMFVIDVNSGLVTYQAQGPHLTPYIPEDVQGAELMSRLPRINDQPYPPVPIVVLGHFDDPRAAQCRATARQLCLDRFVFDRIVDFRPEAVPTPGVTAPPTAFPDPPPSPLFDPSGCAGNVPYSFTGWTTTAALELPYERPGHVYAMVARDAELLTEDGWADDPNGSGHKFQIWGRKICIAEEGPAFEGQMEFGSVPASTYVLWDDGLKVPGDNPLRP